MLSWFSFQEQRVKYVLLDIDGTGSSSQAAALAINNSFETKLLNGASSLPNGKINGTTTDAGGGGQGVSLYEESKAYAWVPQDDDDTLCRI